MRIGAFAVAAVIALCTISTAHAQSDAEFFRGRG
jgi:hypothetical protein